MKDFSTPSQTRIVAENANDRLVLTGMILANGVPKGGTVVCAYFDDGGVMVIELRRDR